MPTDRQPRPGRWGRPVVAGAVMVLVWGVLAWVRPTTTWHLAPLLVVLAPLWSVEESDLPRPASRRLAAVAIGALLAPATTAVLHVTGLLAGPALVGPVAWVEAVLLTAAGAMGAVGWIAWAVRPSEHDQGG